MKPLLFQLSVCAAILAGQARAESITYSAEAQGGGVFEYRFMIDNSGATENVSGMLLLHAGSVFGLDFFSTIDGPVNWGFFAPLPPLIDSLDYFSLDAGSDVPIDGTLAGFSFLSDTDPASLGSADLTTILVGSISNTQTPYTPTQVPEPGGLVLVGTILLVLAYGRRTQFRPD